MIKTYIKMIVTPEESKQVQEICFANGIGWYVLGKNQIMYLEQKYLYVYERYIAFGDSLEYFKEHSLGEVDADLFIKTSGTCIEETPEQELEQNINKEETMEKNEVKSYADVKEYLIAKGLYERVLGLIEGTHEEDIFMWLFTWSKTEEGHNFWKELNDEMLDLDIYDKVESLVQDYKAKQGVEAQPTQKPKQYLCYVQGKALPKHIHKTLEQAKQEAQRLCRKELAKVSVLEVVAEYKAEVLVKEVM